MHPLSVGPGVGLLSLRAHGRGEVLSSPSVRLLALETHLCLQGVGLGRCLGVGFVCPLLLEALHTWRAVGKKAFGTWPQEGAGLL